MATIISPQLLKALTDITGEIHLDSALRIVTQEAIAHRLESIAKQIQILGQKHGMSFEEFHTRFQAEEVPILRQVEENQEQ